MHTSSEVTEIKLNVHYYWLGFTFAEYKSNLTDSAGVYFFFVFIVNLILPLTTTGHDYFL